MEFKDLAPWITIAFTLALSILVPLFTQIANNNHQRKMQREKIEYEKSQEKRKAYEQFLIDVGMAITAYSRETAEQAGTSLHRMYIYAPREWFHDLDALSMYLKKAKTDEAATILQSFGRLIAEDLGKETLKAQKVKNH